MRRGIRPVVLVLAALALLGAGSLPSAAQADRTGVSDTEIVIGIHAPITGAAPLPQGAFDRGKDVYWKYLAERGGVHGRNVRVVFRDDEFNPAAAVRACREMIEQEKVFLLIGAAGSEQITACARHASSVGVPYFSGGVNEAGLRGLSHYFAVSMTYRQQNPMLAQFVKKRLGKSRLAIVVNDTRLLDGTRESMTAAAGAEGLQVVRSSTIGKNASDAELLSEANQLRESGAEVVYLVTSPVNFVRLATHAQGQGYHPVWIGPGMTNGFNMVAEAGCPQVDGAHFLSPFPQLDVIDRLDADFRPAYRRHTGSEPDDIGLALWGLNKVIHQMFEATGRDLSRGSFIATVTSGRDFLTRVYPTVRYTDQVRFGAYSAHLLEADCAARRFQTVATFVNQF